MPERNGSSNDLSSFHLEGKEILVAEDNKVNQIVIQKFLKKMGAHADIVSNGYLAVEMVQINTYDLILMDCQMPVMNGYCATEEIRKLGGGFISIPIIAMTAGIFPEDKAMCMSSGMNDYIFKPIRINELYDKLKSWMK